MDQAAFNSSDVEFEAPPINKQAAYRGQASIDQLIQDAQSDRLTSKRTVVQLQFGHGAPHTRYIQSLWISRFNAFREHTLNQSLNTPFTGNDILRFLDAIIGKVKPRGVNKPAPNDDIVVQAFKVLLAYGEFTWDESDGFKITRRDGRRLQTFVDDAVKANRLTKGAWQKKTWIGFVTLSRMVRAFLDHWHARGCRSWDIVIAKCLSVVLVASLGSRSGDVVRSNGYKGFEHMQWRHIDLYLEGGAEYLNLRAIVTLEFVKGSKDTRNEDTIRYLRPLEDLDCQHVCPIALLMAHALRNGMVSGLTVQEVLDHAAATPALRVVWKFPDLPVLTAFGRKPSRCDLTKVAPPLQLLESIKQMGLISGILTRVYMHATRHGAVRDLAHLPKSNEGFGYCTDELRQTMGHRPATGLQGTTEGYVGGMSRELYNARAENKGKSHRREPKFADQSAYDTVKAPISKDEIRIWNDKNDGPGEGRPDLNELERRRVRHAIRRERLDHFVQTAPPETPSAIGMRDTNPAKLASISPNELNAMSPAAGVGKKSLHSSEKHPRTMIPDGLPGLESDHEEDATGGTLDYTNIDPALFEDDSNLEQLQVHQGDLDLLEANIFPTQDATKDSTKQKTTDRPGARSASTTATACNEHSLFVESGRLMFGVESQQIIPTAEQWVDRYARINVVQNRPFADKWAAWLKDDRPSDSTIWEHSVRGHSRDDPTPWIFYCHQTDQCTYQSLYKYNLTQHQQRYCNQALIETLQANSTRERHLCTWEGCNHSAATKDQLRHHVQSVHNWLPKPCEHACEPATKIYQTKISYAGHQRVKHSGQWPRRCLYPACASDQLFNSVDMMKRHLLKAHGVTDPTEQLQYLPSLPPRTKWVDQTCFMEGCTYMTVRKTRSAMLRHLKSYHQMTDADANRLIDEQAQFVTFTPARRLVEPGSRGGGKRRASVAEDDGEEPVGRRSQKGRKSS